MEVVPVRGPGRGVEARSGYLGNNGGVGGVSGDCVLWGQLFWWLSNIL